MPFVEVFSPAGSVRPEQRAKIVEQLVAEVMVAEGAPDNETARSISWLVWHEPQIWSIGGEQVKAEEAPRYVVRVTVPAGSLDYNEAKKADIVERVTKVLADADDDPDRLYTTPSSFVLITEIPEGNWGGAGRVVSFTDIANYVLSGTFEGLNDEEVREALAGKVNA